MYLSQNDFSKITHRYCFRNLLSFFCDDLRGNLNLSSLTSGEEGGGRKTGVNLPSSSSSFCVTFAGKAPSSPENPSTVLTWTSTERCIFWIDRSVAVSSVSSQSTIKGKCRFFPLNFREKGTAHKIRRLLHRENRKLLSCYSSPSLPAICIGYYLYVLVLTVVVLLRTICQIFACVNREKT